VQMLTILVSVLLAHHRHELGRTSRRSEPATASTLYRFRSPSPPDRRRLAQRQRRLQRYATLGTSYPTSLCGAQLMYEHAWYAPMDSYRPPPLMRLALSFPQCTPPSTTNDTCGKGLWASKGAGIRGVQVSGGVPPRNGIGRVPVGGR
jgi:hypothetical protein